VQFRYQVIGIAMGAVLAVALAKIFMGGFPVLRVDQFTNPDAPGASAWQSAMTFKFVGALKGITKNNPHIMTALRLGIMIGIGTEVLRKLLKLSKGYKQFITGSRIGRVTDFLLDAIILPSPYASSFGGFVELSSVYWWAAGGVGASVFDWFAERRRALLPKAEGELPADMSTVSLVGGGMIAGDSLAALTVGIITLLTTLLSRN